MKRTGLTLALLTLILPAQAQNPTTPPAASATFKQLLSGANYPVTLKMKTLNANEWRRFSLPASGGGGMDFFTLIFAGMMGGGNGADVAPDTGIAYYTQGNTTALGSETFLVAYRAQLKQPNMMQAMMPQNQNPNPADLAPEKMTEETTIALSLLNVKSLKSIADIKPFDLKAEIAESEANAKRMADIVQQAAATVNPGGAAEKQPVVAPKVRAALAADKQLKAEGNAIAVVEEENSITLQGDVVSEAMKKHAEDVVKKLFKEQGIGFQVKNELTVGGAAPTAVETMPTDDTGAAMKKAAEKAPPKPAKPAAKPKKKP